MRTILALMLLLSGLTAAKAADDQTDQFERARLLLSSPDSDARMRGVKLLQEKVFADEKFDKSKALTALKPLCGDPYVFVRIETARTLAKTKDFDAIPLLQGLLQDNDQRVRKAAAAAIKDIGPAPANAIVNQQQTKTEKEKAWAAVFLFLSQPRSQGEQLAYADAYQSLNRLLKAYESGDESEAVKRLGNMTAYRKQYVEDLLMQGGMGKLTSHIGNDDISWEDIWKRTIRSACVEPQIATLKDLVANSPNAAEDLRWNESVVVNSVRNSYGNGWNEKVVVRLAKCFQEWKKNGDDKAFSNAMHSELGGSGIATLDHFLDAQLMGDLRVYAAGETVALKDMRLDFARIYLFKSQ